MCDTHVRHPDVYIDGASIEDIKHRINTHVALYKLKYTEISEIQSGPVIIHSWGQPYYRWTMKRDRDTSGKL